MTSKLHHVSLFTSDLDRSLLLFQELLGFEKLWQVGPLGGKAMASLFGMDDIQAELIMLQNKSNVSLELIHLLKPSMDRAQKLPSLPAPAFLCMEVDDLDGLYEGLTKNGWEPFTPISNMPTPTGEAIRMFCIKTEENVLLEFIGAPSS
jgi:catechol 2,3-dioxygenase-like lactoylglutathione lyase family enzyme